MSASSGLPLIGQVRNANGVEVVDGVHCRSDALCAARCLAVCDAADADVVVDVDDMATVRPLAAFNLAAAVADPRPCGQCSIDPSAVMALFSTDITAAIVL